MKRLLLILLSVLYTWSVSGITINTHFCGQRILSVSFSLSGHDCCCGEEAAKSCCKDEVGIFKISDSHLSAGKTTVDADPGTSPDMATAGFHSINYYPSEPAAFPSLPPPLPVSRLFIENCVLLV